jgi:hypothetical protein
MTASTDSRLRAATCSFRMSRSGWHSALVKARGVMAISGASQGLPRAFQRASCRLSVSRERNPRFESRRSLQDHSASRGLLALEIGFQEIQKILGYLEAELLQRLRNHFAFRRKPVTNNGRRLPEEPDGKSTLPCASSLSTLVFKATDPAHWRTGSPREADPRSSSRRRFHSGCQRA